MQDSLGNPITLTDPPACARSTTSSRASSPARRAPPTCSRPRKTTAPSCRPTARRCTCSPSRAMPPPTRAPSSNARRPAPRAPRPREQRYIEAIAAWAEGDIARAIALHQEQAREHPRDLASLKLGQYHCFNIGDCPGMLRLALAALPAAADVPYLHGMAAFGYEQCHLDARGRGQRAPRDRDGAQGALGPPCARPRDADRGPARRGPGLHAGRERHLGRPQLLHGHPQLVARGAVPDRPGPRCGSTRGLRRAGVGRGQGLLAGPDRRRVAAGAPRAGGHRRRRALAGAGRLPGAAARRPRAALPRPAVPLRPGARRPARGRAPASQHRGLRAAGARLRRGPPGSASPCRLRAACWPTRAATPRAPSKGWAWRCRAWWKSAAAMRSATSSSSCTSMH